MKFISAFKKKSARKLRKEKFVSLCYNDSVAGADVKRGWKDEGY